MDDNSSSILDLFNLNVKNKNELYKQIIYKGMLEKKRAEQGYKI